MSMEMLLVATICLLVGLLIGYLAGSRRAETNRWTRPTPLSPQRMDAVAPSVNQPQERLSVEDLPPEFVSEVRALLAGGKKISAIKLVREVTGLGLKESKELVESWLR